MNKNIKFNYLYRDVGNYKSYNSIIFENPDHLDQDDITVIIKESLMDSEFFIPESWDIAKITPSIGIFGDNEEWHEFESVEVTEEPSDTDQNISEFLIQISSERKIIKSVIKKKRVSQTEEIDFIPKPVEEGTEIFRNGLFQYNITEIIKYIQKNKEKFSIEEIDLKTYNGGSSIINEEHMDSVVLGEPVIFAEISPGNYNLIDGNHRLEKARRMGVEKLDAYRLTSDFARKYLTTKEAYTSYLEYWNEKMS